MRDQKFWIGQFSGVDALWIHDDNPRRPHTLLTSGKHSGGFFNGTKVIERPLLLAEACVAMIEKDNLITKEFFPDMVIGSAFGAITIAYEIARHLGVRAGFTERVDGMMVPKRFDVRGLTVLIVDDVITTGGTLNETIASVEERGGVVLPFILSLVNRSRNSKLGDRTISTLIDYPMPVWTAEDCPLCKAGSKVMGAKGNWEELTGKY